MSEMGDDRAGGGSVQALGLLLALALISGGVSAAQQWPFEVADLSGRVALTILVFGDGGTGEAGQYRVAQAMYDVCEREGCELALMLGDNLYDNGIEVRDRSDGQASLRDILSQFDNKFAHPYQAFERIPGFHF